MMKIWIDIETGSYGNGENIVFIDVNDWTNEEFTFFGELTDNERSEFAEDVNKLQTLKDG